MAAEEAFSTFVGWRFLIYARSGNVKDAWELFKSHPAFLSVLVLVRWSQVAVTWFQDSFCETGDSPDVTTKVQRLGLIEASGCWRHFVSLKSSTFRSSLSSQFFIAKNFIEFPKVAALGLNGSKRIAKAKCLSRGTSSFHSFGVYHQRIQLNTSEVSLLQVEGIGRNIVPVFYAVTRPASINFLIFLAIVVCLS